MEERRGDDVALKCSHVIKKEQGCSINAETDGKFPSLVQV
jgi:hypothetical protein